MSTRNDVAKKANVSGATVSRVFNHPDKVSKETRDLVMRVASELNYSPNAIAQHFVRKRTGNLGVLIPWYPKVHIFSSYYFSELLSGIGKAVENTNYDMVLMFYDRSQSCVDFEQYFRRNKVDGFIILGSTLDDNPNICKLTEQGHRFCLINHSLDTLNVSYVDSDNQAGVMLATNHLYDQGCRKIGFLNGLPQYKNSIDRLSGYKLALEAHNLPFNEQFCFLGNYGFKSGYHTAKKIAHQSSSLDGIVCANDRMAAGLIHGLLEEQKELPENLKIVGFDGSDLSKVTWPPLTTIRIPLFEMGHYCATTFIDQITEKRAEHFAKVYSPELIVRHSSTNKKVK